MWRRARVSLSVASGRKERMESFGWLNPPHFINFVIASGVLIRYMTETLQL